MNNLLEFIRSKENRTVVSVGLFTVVLSLLGMYYWQLLTGRVLLPQTLEQFPLVLDQGQIAMKSEVEDAAQFPGNVPHVGDEFNVVFYISYLQPVYVRAYDFQISYAWGDLELMNWYSNYHNPDSDKPLEFNLLSEKQMLGNGSGSSQVMVIDMHKDNTGYYLPSTNTFITLRFKRKTANATALQWYGDNSRITYSLSENGTNVPVVEPVTGSQVLPAVSDVVILPPVEVPEVCGGIQGWQCPNGQSCVYDDGSVTAPYPDATGRCQVVASGIAQCLNNGGIEWRTFSNGCVDRCQPATGAAPICTTALTEGCDCGVDKCWNGNQCVSNLGTGNSSISWKTPALEVTADDFYIRVFGHIFTAKNATVELTSDQDGAASIDFSAKWLENGKEMRLLMSIRSNLSRWWVNEMRVYDGKTPASWIYFKGTDYINTKFTEAAFGQDYIRNGDVDFYALDQAGDGKIVFKNLRISAFKTCTVQNQCVGGTCYNVAQCQSMEVGNNVKVKLGNMNLNFGSSMNDIQFSVPMSIENGGTQVKDDYDVWAYMPPFGSSGYKIKSAQVNGQGVGQVMCEIQSEGLNAWCSDIRIKGDGTNPAVAVSGNIQLTDGNMRVLQVCARHPSDQNTYCKARQFTFVSGATACPLKAQGDANCNGSITMFDFESWRQEFVSGNGVSADFNGSGSVTMYDFEVWRQHFK